MTYRSLTQAEPENADTTSCAARGAGLFAAGAGLMYVFDPITGRRRRKLIGDRLNHAWHVLTRRTDRTARDLANRTYGLYASARSRLTHHGENARDEILEDRIRARIGHVSSHPRAINVLADQGCVILAGDVLDDEADDVLAAARKTPGVCDVRDYLHRHKTPGQNPNLQGGHARRGASARPDFLQDNWSPATRLIAGATGTVLMGNCLARRTLTAALLGTAGFALFLRSITNLPARRLLGINAGRRAIDVQKTINIDAPVDLVYTFWSNYDNFPLFMNTVKEVRDHGNGVSHWVVAGPAGANVEWDALLTDYVPNQYIAWKSVPGSTVAHAGIVDFEENEDGSTRVTVWMSYNPPAGAIGHAVASAFGADPKSQLDQDLLRLKTLIETGNFPHDAAQHETPSGTVTSR
jgi:uncharacterized membrane protein